MLARILRLLAVPALLLAAPVHAAFHLWTMNELYSNADGSVQFLELTAITGGQQFMSGHMLTVFPTAGGQRQFTFPNDLPGDTSGRRMLIATQGFAALNIVTPDYVVPNGFFAKDGGTIDFAGADAWVHPALPQDTRSLNRDGTTATNSPRNFAGTTGTVSGASPLNFQGLWYRGEVESGWGVNIAHQGDIFFVTWFTYDTDGSQMWLVAPDVRKGAGSTYGGQLFRTTGPAFNSVPFTPIAGSNVTNVGSVSFSFTDANNGTFTYTVNNVTASKPIVRQVFGTLPNCTAGGSTGTPGVLNFQDLWYAAPAESEAGWGVNVTHQGDILFVTWFTYDSSGRGMWIVGPRMERTAANTYSGGLFRTTGPAYNASPWNPNNVAATPVGNATFTFSSASAGTFNYTVNGITQTKNITKQSFGSPATVCR